MLPIALGPWTEASRPRQIVRAAELRAPGATRKQVQALVLAWLGMRYNLALGVQAADQAAFDVSIGNVRVAAGRHPWDRERWGVAIESVQAWMLQSSATMLWRTEVELVCRNEDVRVEIVHTYHADAVTNAYTPHAELTHFLAQALGARDAGLDVLATGRMCLTHNSVHGLIEHLLDPTRSMPVAVIAQEAGSKLFPASPHRLAASLSGTAHVVGLYAAAVPIFRSRMGHLLYVGEGAGRIYMPGLESNSRPLDHPLLRQQAEPTGQIAPDDALDGGISQIHFVFERRMRHAAQHASTVLHHQRMALRTMHVQPSEAAAQAAFS